MHRMSARLLFGFTLVFLLASAALAQNTGQISGTVNDQSGAVVAGATVTAQNPATSF